MTSIKLLTLIILFVTPTFFLSAENVKAKTEALVDLKKGQALLKKGDIKTAEKHFSNSLRHLPGPSSFQRQMKRKINHLLKISKARRLEMEKDIRIQQFKVAALTAHQDIKRREQLQGLRMSALVGKMNQHLEDGDFAAAERLGKDIMQLDPNQKSVKQTLNFARKQANIKKRISLAHRKHEGKASEKIFNEENFIIQTDTLRFPKDFREHTAKRTDRRKKEKKEESWRTNLRNKLQQSVKYEFESTPLSEVLKKLEIAYEVAIIVDKDAWAGDLGEGEVLVDLSAGHLSLETALFWLFEPFDLRVGLKYGTIYVAPKDKLKGNKVVKSYDIRDLVLVVPDYVAPSITLGNDGEGTIIEMQEPEYDGFNPDDIIELLESIVESMEEAE
jgi:hypothetical protein